MQRAAFKMFLKPGMKDEYKRRHAKLFPELRRLLTESGVRNYSIYLDEDTNTLYAYQELIGDGGSQDLVPPKPANAGGPTWRILCSPIPTTPLSLSPFRRCFTWIDY